MKLLLATNNLHKLEEYRALMEGLPLELRSLRDEAIFQDVEETGQTFQENALIKARAYSSLSGVLTLADDSGLEVEALGGAPGVYSSRYAGPGATDRQRVEYLLAKMNGIPWKERTARFRCVIAIARPAGEVQICEGECRGIIALEPQGEHGFGYDPVFFLPELGLTMAELPALRKNQISHRAVASRKAREVLAKMAGLA